MKNAFVLILPLLLCGCGMDFAGFGTTADDDGDAVQAQTVSAPTPTTPGAPANASFCQGVAVSDATGHGFDDATQKQVAQQSFTQCLALYHP